MESEAVKELTKQRDALLEFVQEYIEAWNDGMAGDSCLLLKANDIVTKMIESSTT